MQKDFGKNKSSEKVITGSQRFKELDSLRGLAACTVMVNHFLAVLPQTWVFAFGGYSGKYQGIINRLIYSPLHILCAGHEAVILFFLLSGFVLSLPFYSRRKVCYSSFLVKRICRIYIPYAVAVTVAIAAAMCFSRHGIHELTSWFNCAWTTPLSWQLIVNHYLLIGSFENWKLSPSFWSLVQEMRISIIFPLLMFYILQLDWKVILISAIGLYYISCKLDPLVVEKLHLPSNDLQDTPSYMAVFLVGALIAKHRRAIIQFYQSLPRLGHYLILPAGIVVYTYQWTFAGTGYIDPINNDAIICIGASIIVITALSSPRLSLFLQKKPLLFLGEISYSIYLYHAIIVIWYFNILYGKIPSFAILGITLISVFVVSTAAYSLFEEPSMRLGRYLTRF